MPKEEKTNVKNTAYHFKSLKRLFTAFNALCGYLYHVCIKGSNKPKMHPKTGIIV